MNEIGHNNTENKYEEMFFQLFMAHQRTFYAYILASVHNYSDAEDILQETATVMWRRFSDFQPGTNFISWGIVIARYHILNHFKAYKRSRLQFDDDLLKQLADTTLEEASRIDSLTDGFRQCYAKLSAANRKILKLRYKDGMTIKAIANLTGKPIHGMYKTFARLQDALQNCIVRILNRETMP